ncbi:spermidine synthase [Novosphingobium sp. JCM 18896]|uniref:spermine/spermidine synthase domain-containing protein n=1 Tax=Novosphingobium sp. JCM 18896 TaxID=2989731 RepID=UPI0022234457|nr:spermidine synthase [Novosphingobium sp. JCM 18896]MCW1431549.1 spermidine synthase [Novosphingobium sp. JCM 18896]
MIPPPLPLARVSPTKGASDDAVCAGKALLLDDGECIGRARVPGGIELRLIRHDDEFSIVLEDNELMSTRVSASEIALATMTHARLGARTASEWLIGGYGMGFTLRAALAALDADACVTVAELVPEIIQWARGPMQAVTAGCLDDARVMLVDEDVATLINAAIDSYDAILLDVDNGPEGLTRAQNDYLYSPSGLEAASRALKHDGILAVWSAEPDAHFPAKLRDAGFDVAEVEVNDGHKDDADIHVLWFARKRAEA